MHRETQPSDHRAELLSLQRCGSFGEYVDQTIRRADRGAPRSGPVAFTIGVQHRDNWLASKKIGDRASCGQKSTFGRLHN